VTSSLQDGRNTIGHGDGPAYLVTGAAGFIGSHLCDRLLSDGARVWGLDNFDDFYDPSRKRRNLESALGQDSMHLVEGDVRDPILLDGLMADVPFDAVFHLAARPGAPESAEDPSRTFDVNVSGTLTLLDAVRRHGIAHFIYASSNEVYGDRDAPPYHEDMPADRPLSPYAASKRACEMLCHAYHHLHGLTVHCLRLSSVFGPRQRPDLAIDELARGLVEGGWSPELNGERGTVREYSYVDDVVDGFVLSLERTRRRNGEDPEYSVINLGGSEAVELGELAERLGDAMGGSAENRRSRGEPLDDTRPICSVEKGRELLGYRPRVSLDEGLAEVSRWLRETIFSTSADIRPEESRSAGDGSRPA